MRKRIAIIGAGLAGVTIARSLSAQADVTLFEKSRGFGGRMAVRRRAGFEWDHGAQYFTARGSEFRAIVEAMQTCRAVTTWPVDIADPAHSNARSAEPRFVGQPAMSSFVGALGGGLDVRLQTQVSQIQARAGDWRLLSAEGADLGAYDFVVSTAPAPQTGRLLPKCFSGHAALSGVRMSGCFTLMLGLAQEPALTAAALRPVHPTLSWIAVNTSKPGRLGGPSLVVHSRNDWADIHMEEDADMVREMMLAALRDVTAVDFSTAKEIYLHRWRYANVEKPLGQPFLLDEENGLAAAGDWCLGGRVECAFDSGRQLAETLAKRIIKG